ncbi:hypothetical protein AN4511.2 [Aspergillus nidulans FGSC A4]|uniref:Uncharacterized protein n=1 Tax=Emericella nidulans (strain FGSC A4 / ATCC 38163 / CBS 112.46 / NRRL 194 / M139) TaxID=227321 RepID=Q5B4L9_EMENI|nr:hypothetical protein [Aspergillus nidulans FGSC A4]EAA60854.1 hypothetical protein AN4511.2 [Aspergillus nidulans FGSC A4]CBF77362.1 TPA: conserved hypothetical protein [Aspergillus nidulans FGSC A4]|eukprot:XP_662115.1 hypothetical protein AN4511.2 [Aspergillus nidulans FGSC A4]
MDAEQPSGTRNPESTTLYKILHWDKFFESEAPPRLGMEVGQRLPLTALSAFSAGLAIGATHGSKKAAYRFRAENAHRFPTTPTGWFQYHKTKNYISIVGGVKEGMKMGFKLGAGALAFCLFEETVDYARHDQRDFISTVTAGLSFSGIYSLLARHDVYTAARTTKLGLKLSLVYGLMQDALESLKGNRPAYIDFILGRRSKVE